MIHDLSTSGVKSIGIRYLSWYNYVMPAKRLGFDRTWTADLAYVVGIIATDGNLSPDKRHISITSKDKEIITSVKRILGLQNKIGMKARGGALHEKKYFVLQFGNMNMYEFLEDIGLTRKKSKTLSSLDVPKSFFRDFLRGCIDGDGSITVSKHPESKHPQLKLRLCSASFDFVTWVKSEIARCLQVGTGWIYTTADGYMHTLTFGKKDSINILKQMYHDSAKFFLRRKHIVAKRFIK